jgi:hypothetical protein
MPASLEAFSSSYVFCALRKKIVPPPSAGGRDVVGLVFAGARTLAGNPRPTGLGPIRSRELATRPGSTATCGERELVTPQAATGKLVTPQAARQWSRLRRPGTSCGERGHVCRRPAHRLCESMGFAKYSDTLFDTYGAHWLHKTQAILRIVDGRPTASRLAAFL